MKTKSLVHYVSVLLLFMLFFTLNSFAQEKKKAFEISTSSFDQFKIRYKFGDANHLFRITSTYLSAVKDNNSDNSDFGAGVGIGIEFPKKLQEKLSIYYGFELNNNYRYQKHDSNNMYSVGAGGILGFSYSLNEVLHLGAEITPGIYYNYSKSDFNSGNSIGFGFDNNMAEIILGFAF